MEDLLTHLEKCWWSIKIQSFEDKWHFLQYAGRYVRRPPIAQRRITWIGERTVKFWCKEMGATISANGVSLIRPQLTFHPS